MEIVYDSSYNTRTRDWLEAITRLHIDMYDS